MMSIAWLVCRSGEMLRFLNMKESLGGFACVSVCVCVYTCAVMCVGTSVSACMCELKCGFACWYKLDLWDINLNSGN